MISLVLSLTLSQVTPPPLAPSALTGDEKKRPVQAPTSSSTPAPDARPAAAQKLSFAQQAFGLAHSAYRAGSGSANEAATWSLRIYESQKDTEPKAAQYHLERMVALEKLARERSQAGASPMLDVLTVGYFRAQAEQLAGKK